MNARLKLTERINFQVDANEQDFTYACCFFVRTKKGLRVWREHYRTARDAMEAMESLRQENEAVKLETKGCPYAVFGELPNELDGIGWV